VQRQLVTKIKPPKAQGTGHKVAHFVRRRDEILARKAGKEQGEKGESGEICETSETGRGISHFSMCETGAGQTHKDFPNG